MREILDRDQIESKNTRRRNLLPKWVIFFTWLFMAIGLIVPIAIIMGFFGKNFLVSLYGLTSIEPISYMGILILGLFLLKAIVAFGLWTEKKWSINLAIADGILGILICTFTMAVLPFIDDKIGATIVVRLELLILIPYVLCMKKIRTVWYESTLP